MVKLNAQSWDPDREEICGTHLALRDQLPIFLYHPSVQYYNLLTPLKECLDSKIFVIIMSMNKMKPRFRRA